MQFLAPIGISFRKDGSTSFFHLVSTSFLTVSREREQVVYKLSKHIYIHLLCNNKPDNKIAANESETAL